VPVKKNQLAMITVMEVFAYQYLVDNFGNIPYTEALDINNVTPKYDDAATIYLALADSLTAAIADFDNSEAGFSSSADLLYGGDLEAWEKFANSILFKMGLRMADYDDATGRNWLTSAISGGVFTSNADNATFLFIENQPYTNPIYDYFVIQSRNTDFVAAQEFLDKLEAVNDPRIAAYFDDNITAGYIGGPYGAAGNAYNELTHVNPTISNDPEYPGTVMDYSSIAFGMAEAVERGYITSGTAAEYYTDGINASMEFWGIDAGDAAAYIAQADVDYSSAAGTWRQKIGIQKYIASYNQGHEAWAEAKRLDFPALLVAAETSTPNPFRFTYPVNESLINGTQYTAASSAIGGDKLTTKLFWDVN